MVLHLKVWESRSLPGLQRAEANRTTTDQHIVLEPFFTPIPKRRLSLTAQAAFLRLCFSNWDFGRIHLGPRRRIQGFVPTLFFVWNLISLDDEERIS